MDEVEQPPSTWADDVWIEHGFHPDHGEIQLIGEIDEAAVRRVMTALFLCRSGVRLRIDSGGGSVVDGKAIYDMIRLYKSRKECLVEGTASSTAAIIVQAFDRRVISASSHIMIHDGKDPHDDEQHSRDFERSAEQSKKDRHWYYVALAKRCGRTPQYWGKLCTRDTYFSAKEALRVGLVDQVI